VISLIILHVKILEKNYQKIDDLHDILYSILAYFDMKYILQIIIASIRPRM